MNGREGGSFGEICRSSRRLVGGENPNTIDFETKLIGDRVRH